MTQVPRVVDHDQRRALIADAFTQQVADHGLAAATFARVASAADVSVGLIQHYFASRDELLRFAFAASLRRRDERVADVVAAGEEEHQTIRAILAAALRELLPIDARRRAEHAVTQHLLAQAHHDDALARAARVADRDLHRRIAVAVDNGKRCGEVRPEALADPAASRILATAYGLGTRVALDPAGSLDRAAADDVLAAVLDAVFTGRCRRHETA